MHVSARLAQSAERKALNLVVVGSSPTVGVSSLVSVDANAASWIRTVLRRFASNARCAAHAVSTLRKHGVSQRNRSNYVGAFGENTRMQCAQHWCRTAMAAPRRVVADNVAPVENKTRWTNRSCRGILFGFDTMRHSHIVPTDVDRFGGSRGHRLHRIGSRAATHCGQQQVAHVMWRRDVGVPGAGAEMQHVI